MPPFSTPTFRAGAAGALALAASLAGCDSGQPGSPAAGSTPAHAALTAAGPSAVLASSADDAAEAASVSELARTVAVALGSSPAVRNEVRRDLADSRYTAEHKLHLQDHLAAQAADGRGKLLAAMAAETGRTTDEVLALARSVRDVEFYLPVADHRARWRGGKDMIVAALLDDEAEAPVGFGLDGRPVALSADEAPDTPVLSVVPVETDFATALPPTIANTNDAGGAAIGTYAVGTYAAGGAGGAQTDVIADPCNDPTAQFQPAECGGGGGGGSSTRPPGLYYTAADLEFVGEAWAKGSPEIEVHLIENFTHAYVDRYGPPQFGGRPSENYASRCDAGNYSSLPSAYRFNQDSERWRGSVLIANNALLAEYGYNPANPSNSERLLSVTLWEDDNRECELVTNLDFGIFETGPTTGVVTGVLGIAFGAGITAGGIAEGSKAAIVVGASYIAAGVSIIAVSAHNALKTNDDYLGLATIQPNQTGNTMTYRMVRGPNESENGTIQLTTRL